MADGKPFATGEKDLKFITNLWAKEAPGILVWALEGLSKFFADGDWHLSERQEKVRDDILDESSSIVSFVSEMTKESPEERGGITTDSLYTGYRGYCHGRGWEGYFFHHFTRAIPQIIYSRYRVSGDNKVEMEGGTKLRGYPGIRLKPPVENS